MEILKNNEHTLSNQVARVRVNPVDILVLVHPLSIGRDDGRSHDRGREQDLSKHDSLGADLLGQGPSVDAVDGGDVELLEPSAERGYGKVVREVLRVLADDQTSNMNLVRLKVLGQILQKGIHGLAGGDTIVSDQREGEHEDLASV